MLIFKPSMLKYPLLPLIYSSEFKNKYVRSGYEWSVPVSKLSPVHHSATC